MKLFWKFYAILFFAVLGNHCFQLWNRNSLPSLYYHTMLAFSYWYIIPYLLNILNLLLGLIAGILIFDYAFTGRALGWAPYWLFYARLLSEFTGHSYEWQLIQSAFIQGSLWGILDLASLVLPLVPSYFAHWYLTFKLRNKKIPR